MINQRARLILIWSLAVLVAITLFIITLAILSGEVSATPSGSNPKIIINEFYRGTELSNGDEWIEVVLIQDLTSTELEGFSIGDSTSTTVAKFSGYKFTDMGRIATDFPKGTIIVIGGSLSMSETISYDPTNNDWNILLHANKSYITGNGSSSSGNLAGTDVVYVDTDGTNGDSIISADGFAVNWDSSPGTLGANADVTISNVGDKTGTVLQTGLSGATVPENWATNVITGNLTMGEPNGDVNTAYIENLRSGDTTISKDVSSSSIGYHENVTYTVVLENRTAVSDTNVLFTDTLPISVTFASWINQPINAVVSNDIITWTGTVTATEAITFTFITTHTGNYGEVVTNTATFSGTVVTGTAQAAFSVPTNTPDMIVSKTAPNYTVAGETIVYTVVVGNEGGGMATGWAITDTLPISVTYIGSNYTKPPVTSTVGSREMLVWSSDGNWASGDTETFNITATVNASVTHGTIITNDIEISTATADDPLENNNGQFTSTVQLLTPIHEIQGSGDSVTDDGTIVTIRGVVVGDYQGDDKLSGFFVQEEKSDVDSDPNTSEGIFVYCGNCPVDVTEGNIVTAVGVQSENFDMSQIDASNNSVTIQDAGNNLGLVTAVSINLPAPKSTGAEDTFEQFEGMLVQFMDELTVTEYSELARFGQIILSKGGKLRQFTHTDIPSTTGYTEHQQEIATRRIILDDLNNSQNIDPVYHPQPGGFSISNTIRGGDTVANLTGIMHWSWGGHDDSPNAWRIRPQVTNPVTFTNSNPRETAPPVVSGNIKIASFNLLNYFTTIDTTTSYYDGDCGPSATLDCRGADSANELEQQITKTVAALELMDVDIVGLMEIENDASPGTIATLVAALNIQVGAGTYAYIDTGFIGTDAIKVGIIYKPDVVSPIGSYAILDTEAFMDPNNLGSPKNRPALAQTFQVSDANNDSFGGAFTIVVNHLKSKGSSCGAGDDDTTMGQGNCNGTRTGGTKELVAWLATDPTDTLTNLGAVDTDILITGDLNAYRMENPITEITNAGYTDVISSFGGINAYSFVFNGEWGYLDHALSSQSLTAQVVDAVEWHINADEVSLLDYNDIIDDAGEPYYEAKPPTNSLYSPDSYRSSDHDPLIVGLNLSSTITSAIITITSPISNTEFVATDNVSITIPITIATANFIIDELPANGGTGDGHWHIWLDGNMEGMVYDNDTELLLSVGTHTIMAQLVDNDHQPTGSTSTVIVKVASQLNHKAYLPSIMKP